MIKVALIGAGKMGISHLSILGAHPEIEIVGVADPSSIVTDILNKYTTFTTFSDYKIMLKMIKPDAVFISVPTKFHTLILEDVMLKGIHVFVEKPFCLDVNEGARMVAIAKRNQLINQVGYHNKFIGTFDEVKRIISDGFLGEINHFMGESYGPVVIKEKQSNWRSKPEEGGGCLMDYASHVIDLINYLISPITLVEGVLLKKIYSKNVEDAVFALLKTENNISGVLSVNWSEETFRKMSTLVTINGTKGKIISDASELKVYFNTNICPSGYTKGWNIKYITDLTAPVDFYLRGEEYSAQIDYFINAILEKVPNNKNTFENALMTDLLIEKIKNKINI